MSDLRLEDIENEYSLKRHIIIIIIVALFFVLLFALWPLIWALIVGDTNYSNEPSERLNDIMGFLFLIKKK